MSKLKLNKVLAGVKLLKGVVKKNKDNDVMMDDINDILEKLNDYLTTEPEPKEEPISKQHDHGMGFDLY